jgi:hypothetical protein
MEYEPEHRRMHLFVIRLWTEKHEQGMVAWRGKVQNVGSGKDGYFLGWQALVELLQTFVSDHNEEDHKK